MGRLRRLGCLYLGTRVPFAMEHWAAPPNRSSGLRTLLPHLDQELPPIPIVGLFWLVVGAACHGSIVIFDIYKSYDCEGR
jgi:hypothetical protein